MILPTRFLAVNVCAQARVDALDLRFSENPSIFDGVAAHVEQHAAPGTIHIPEPGRVRAEMLLTLFDEEEGRPIASFSPVPAPNVLGNKAEFLGVHQQNAGLPACRDHAIRFLERPAQWFLNDDVLAGGRRGDHLGMQVVRDRHRDDVDILAVEQVPVVGKAVRNAAFRRETGGLAWSPPEATATISASGSMHSAAAWMSLMNPLPIIPTRTFSMESSACLSRPEQVSGASEWLL